MAENMDIVESPETRVLRLEGNWTVERAHELKRVLLEVLKSGHGVVIELEELVEADLSCLQLLCSAHLTSLRLGKHFALHEKKSETFKRMACDAGFVRTIGCHKDPYKNCLWIGDWKS